MKLKHSLLNNNSYQGEELTSETENNICAWLNIFAQFL